MNTQSFLDNFHTIARAPGGVSRARDLVYFFAITGGLSRSEAGDSDAKLILDDSLQAKLDYYEENSVRQGARKHSEIIQIVKRVPGHWVMVAAGDLIHLINGRAFKAADWKKSGLPIIRIQNLNNPTAPFNYFQGEVAEGHRVRTGDMLLSWSGTPGTSFGAFIWNGGDAVLNQHIFKVAIYSSKISKEYLRMAINASLDALIGSARGGVGLKHVTKGQIESLQIPLPPLEEQKRIVAKVDELMRLCDRLEAQQQEREELLPLLSRANHSRFVTEPTTGNLLAIFHQPGAAFPCELRKSILELAVRGVLVPQMEPADSVDDLLERIAAERQAVGRRESALIPGPSPVDTLRFDIPSTWRWLELDRLLIAGPTNGISPKAVETETSVRSLTLSATTSGRFRGEHTKFISNEVPPDSDLWLEDGDILVQRGNTAEYVGVPAVYHGAPRSYIYPDLMMRIRIAKALDVDFIHLAMSAEPLRNFLRERATGTAGTMPKINHGTLKSLPIPIPPLKEQQQVVARVAQFMAIIDRLDHQSKEKLKVAEAFAKAAVAAITSTEFTENERMKPPKTEVVTALKIGHKPKNAALAPLAALLAAEIFLAPPKTAASADANRELSAKELWQLSGLEIDAFYRQLRTEMANGWIDEDKDKRDVMEVEAR